MKKILTFIFITLFFLITANTVFGAEITCGKEKLSDEQQKTYACILGTKIDTGNNLNGFTQIMVATANWILGITGSLALLAFVVGGAMWLASSGNPQMVERGKATLIGAVIGLIIIFSSWLIIKYVTEGMGGEFKPGGNTNTPAQNSTQNANDTINQQAISKCESDCVANAPANDVSGNTLAGCEDLCKANPCSKGFTKVLNSDGQYTCEDCTNKTASILACKDACETAHPTGACDTAYTSAIQNCFMLRALNEEPPNCENDAQTAKNLCEGERSSCLGVCDTIGANCP